MPYLWLADLYRMFKMCHLQTFAPLWIIFLIQNSFLIIKCISLALTFRNLHDISEKMAQNAADRKVWVAKSDFNYWVYCVMIIFKWWLPPIHTCIIIAMAVYETERWSLGMVAYYLMAIYLLKNLLMG